MIKPLDSRIRPIGFCLALATLSLPTAMAGSYSGSSSSLDSTAQREIVRRQEDLAAADRLIIEGDRALARQDYESAYTSYMQAVDIIGSGPAVTAQRATALNKFSTTAVAYAQFLIDHGKYQEAEKVAKTVLLVQYNPTYRPAIALLANLEQPDYYNKTVTPQFAGQRDQVSKLLLEADGYFSRGSYDLATKRYEQVLNVDPYNIAARKGMEKIDASRQQYDNEAYNETRSQMLWQVQQSWALPYHKYAGGKDTVSTTRNDVSRNEAMIAKLNRIIIPRVDFRDTTIREAVDFLRQASKKLDSLEPDASKKGVNIFLKLPTVGLAAGTSDIVPPAPGGIPTAPGGLPGGLPGAAGASVAPVTTEDTTITLALNNIPLYEALRYVAAQAGLKIKVDPVAVSIVPLSDVSQDLITKEYKVLPTFIPKNEAPAADAGATFGAAVATPSAAPRIQGRRDAKEYLASLGIPFPEGASAQYIPAGSKLVVRNTQDNIDLIDVIVDSSETSAPTQVQIESKFVEINQNNLKELGFSWLMGPLQIGNGVYGTGGSQNVDTSSVPFVSPDGTAIGTDNVTQGLRSGQGNTPNSAVSVNSIDALLAGGSALASGAAPAIFGIAGVYTNPQFQVAIRALDQRKGIDVMSAPTVTTKSGAKAVVNVIREFRYPTEFDPPQIPQTVGAAANNVAGTDTSGVITNPIITPTTPSAFETRNLGVTLEVTPTVGADGYTIDLELAPEVVDFDGFINYGSPILTLTAPSTANPFARPTSVEVSPNVINQPVFDTRKVNTNITIWDGMTIAIGGLIREDVQKVQDKVPILGDVPLVGRLFRSDVNQTLKQNLIIFVSAKLIDAEGNPVRSDSEKEEVVEPLGLPDDIPAPQVDMKGLPAEK